MSMKLNKQQKITGLVLAVALIVLAMDKLLLSNPESGSALAQAASINTTQAVETRPQLPAAEPAQDNLAQNWAGLADQLQVLAEQQQLELSEVPDVFATPYDWFDDADQQWMTTETGTPELSKADNFKQNHVLKVVFVSGDQSAAFINDLPLRIGDVIDGFELVSVANRSVMLQSKETKVKLELLK